MTDQVYRFRLSKCATEARGGVSPSQSDNSRYGFSPCFGLGPFNSLRVSWCHADKIPSVFDPPAGVSPYEYVFDFTGEVWTDRSEEVRRLDASCLLVSLFLTLRSQ
jgi:hypothetical protein